MTVPKCAPRRSDPPPPGYQIIAGNGATGPRAGGLGAQQRHRLPIKPADRAGGCAEITMLPAWGWRLPAGSSPGASFEPYTGLRIAYPFASSRCGVGRANCLTPVGLNSPASGLNRVEPQALSLAFLIGTRLGGFPLFAESLDGTSCGRRRNRHRPFVTANELLFHRTGQRIAERIVCPVPQKLHLFTRKVLEENSFQFIARDDLIHFTNYIGDHLCRAQSPPLPTAGEVLGDGRRSWNHRGCRSFILRMGFRFGCSLPILKT